MFWHCNLWPNRLFNCPCFVWSCMPSFQIFKDTWCADNVIGTVEYFFSWPLTLALQYYRSSGHYTLHLSTFYWPYLLDLVLGGDCHTLSNNMSAKLSAWPSVWFGFLFVFALLPSLLQPCIKMFGALLSNFEQTQCKYHTYHFLTFNTDVINGANPKSHMAGPTNPQCLIFHQTNYVRKDSDRVLYIFSVWHHDLLSFDKQFVKNINLACFIQKAFWIFFTEADIGKI